ncbi:MAG TPA: hypothetical protein VMU94_09825 [Streptosporangiaceae bacterium]|nr:hypothetical protein [Streptosporangiaceae bacterium]
MTITPSILCLGRPGVRLSPENGTGSANLAPMSSARALGQVIVFGLGATDRLGIIPATAAIS